MIFWKNKPSVPSRPNNIKIVPEVNANIFSRILFFWPGELLSHGYNRPLQKEDLYFLDNPRLAKNITDKFANEWKKEIEKYKVGKKPSLLKALDRTIGWHFWCSLFTRLIGSFLQSISPLIMQAIVTFAMESFDASSNNVDSPSVSKGLILSTFLFLNIAAATLFIQWSHWEAVQSGILARTILITSINRKSMVLSPSSRTLFTEGKITNLMSTDTTRIDSASIYVQTMIVSPFQLMLVLSLLVFVIGPTALTGFGLLIIAGFLQGKIMSVLTKVRSKVANITDERVKITLEILQGIRIIKYYAWEDSFLNNIHALREKELGEIRALMIVRAFVTGIATVIPIFANILSFTVFVLTGGTLNPSIAFASMALINILRTPLKDLPQGISLTTDALVSIYRIQDMLLTEETEYCPKNVFGSNYAIKVENGKFLWADTSVQDGDIVEQSPCEPADNELLEPLLTDILISESCNYEQKCLSSASRYNNINLEIPRGILVAVIGSVGSGKSSLLLALIGEMKKKTGEIVFGGNISYCPQTAWIQNGTLRENITFGLPFDQEKYQRAVRACCLESDILVLPAGDLTEIGENGINLSGGQKQRVNLARAVYFDSDIILLDDPLSAVDAYVGRQIFTNCILGVLASKTRILVTHQLQLLPKVDYIIYMEDGKIAEQGTYEQLMRSNRRFAKLTSHKEVNTKNKEMASTRIDTFEEIMEKEPKGQTRPHEFMSKEEQLTGAIANVVYLSYARAAGGIKTILLIFFLLILMQGTDIGNTLWLSYWTSDQFGLSTEFYIIIYCALGVSESVFSTLYCLALYTSILTAAKNLHEKAIQQILRSPIKFFDTTPLGRIINRLSKDVDSCDNMLSESCRIYFHSLANVIGTSLLISVVFLWSLVVLIPLLITYYYTALYFRVTYRELKRLDSILRSHLYAHFSETLCGLSTIRAYNVQDQFLRNNENFMDQENRAYFLMAATIRWLCVRLGIIASVLIYCASLLSVIQRFEIEPAIIGFVLSHAMSLPDDVIRCVRLFAEVEANMNSVERLVHYSDNLESEAALIIPENQPSLSWPAKGEITIENLTMQYGSENPTVLKDITVHIKASEKVGIVGRTGCGKSTLATSFFRFIEPTSGKVIIDGIDITTIGLKDLRTKITIIPQEPVLFNGTIRSNLDPFNEYDDATLWNALQACLMADKIDQDYCLEPDEKALLPANLLNNSSNPLQTKINLYSLVKECGINFSHGQKQLIALARALLRKSKLIIMDEATANLDHKTDQLIQNIIREMFGKSTIITIAHRLRTVINYDRILVMCDGRIVEDDSPYVLLQNPKSTFREMCKSSNQFDELVELAKKSLFQT